jgi:hypothetical protein
MALFIEFRDTFRARSHPRWHGMIFGNMHVALRDRVRPPCVTAPVGTSWKLPIRPGLLT